MFGSMKWEPNLGFGSQKPRIPTVSLPENPSSQDESLVNVSIDPKSCPHIIQRKRMHW